MSRFPHGGKRCCQKRTFKLIDKVYQEYLKVNNDLFVLFIDSDCILDKVCIQNFMYEMELKPGSKNNMLAMTGIITSTTEKNSLITLLQDMEYIHGQLFERSVESGCGAVTCLPGALTVLRFSAFKKLAKYYFSDKTEQCEDLFDYGKMHLGEDRWLTHLFMIASEHRYQIGLSTGAFCKTEAVQTFKSLLKQRRRWFLGFVTNEVCMLTDIRLWKRYPMLCIIRLAQNTIRTTALLFFIVILSLATTSQRIDDLPIGFIGVSLGLNWLLMAYFAVNLGRYKIMLYPVFFVVGPFFNWCYMVYGIFTAGQRTWGGPRADAGLADKNTTPAEAVQQAEATGDDLNVVPETFRPAIEARALAHGGGAPPISFQPPERFEGRFRSTQLTLGWARDDSQLSIPAHLGSHQGEGPAFHRPRQRSSFESYLTASSAGHPINMPRRVESFIGADDVYPHFGARSRSRPPSSIGSQSEARATSSAPSHVQSLSIPEGHHGTRPVSIAIDDSTRPDLIRPRGRSGYGDSPRSPSIAGIEASSIPLMVLPRPASEVEQHETSATEDDSALARAGVDGASNQSLPSRRGKRMQLGKKLKERLFG